jgi:hypothetical protein
MNKFLILLAFVTVLSTASSAQSIATLKSLGQNEETIYGMSGAHSFYIKVAPTIQIKGSKLVLYIEPSEALIKKHSYINVIINNRPVYSSNLLTDSVEKIVLNLSKDDVSPDKFLKIQIKTLLAISDDACKDLENPAMWVKIKDYSYLELAKNSSAVNDINISNCFDSMRAIVYPADPSLHDLKAVAWAYSRLKKSQTKKILVFEYGQVPDSIKNYIMVGNMSAIPSDKKPLIGILPGNKQGLLYLSKKVNTVVKKIDTVVILKRNGRRFRFRATKTETDLSAILFVSGKDNDGYEKAISALGNINILNSSFGSQLIIKDAYNDFIKSTNELESKVTLKQIGGSGDFLSGMGSLKSSYTFKNTDFTFTPNEITVKFVGNYSGLSTGDRGFFNIYLNGLLISSDKLDASGKLNTSITVQRTQLRKFNTLESEFRFFPINGECKNSFITFFGEIDVNKSYIESKTPFMANNLSFYQYPEAFNSGKTEIVLSKQLAKYLPATVGQIIYDLNDNINSHVFPEFAYSEQVTENDLEKFNIIALLDKDDNLMSRFPNAPIKFDQNFRIYDNTENNKLVYSLSDTVATGLAQILYGPSNNPTLILTATGSRHADAFLAASTVISEQLSTLSSNVCVTDVNSNKYFFNINQLSENIEYIETKNGFSRFWDNYHLYILLTLLILILLLFFYVRFKVQRSQELYNE